MIKRKILVITPISHLLNVEKILRSIPASKIVYLPDCEYIDFKKHSDSFAIFTNPNKSTIFLGKDNLKEFDTLKFICTASTGTVHIDKDFCKNKNINIISLTEERNVINKISSTAEHAFALMIASIRNIPEANNNVSEKNWDYEPFIGRQIDSLTIGVIGYGRLGTFFANYAESFGANVLVYDPYKSVIHTRIRQSLTLEELAISSDIISLHVHVTEETNQMINSEFLAYCKDSVLIINTSRGEVVNENHLINFLKKNKSAKYATDVLSNEVNDISKNPIMRYHKDHKNQITITPHIGGMTKEAQNLAFDHAAKLLKASIEKI